MFPCRPPFSYPWVGEVVVHRSLDFVPERFLQRTVPIINEHALCVPRKSGEERAEPELVWCIQALKGLHSAQEHLGKLATLLPGLDQFAPLRGQNIDPGASALLVLVPNLNREIN